MASEGDRDGCEQRIPRDTIALVLVVNLAVLEIAFSIGMVLGGIVVVAALAGAPLWWRRRRSSTS